MFCLFFNVLHLLPCLIINNLAEYVLNREQVVPRAVLYFTGEALDDSDEEFDEDEDDEDDDEESGPGSYPKFPAGGRGGQRGQAAAAADGKNPDCKQQ